MPVNGGLRLVHDIYCISLQGGLFDDVIAEKKNKEEEDEEQEKTPPKKESRPRTKSGRAVPAGAVSIFGGKGRCYGSFTLRETDSGTDWDSDPIPIVGSWDWNPN